MTGLWRRCPRVTPRLPRCRRRGPTGNAAAAGRPGQRSGGGPRRPRRPCSRGARCAAGPRSCRVALARPVDVVNLPGRVGRSPSDRTSNPDHRLARGRGTWRTRPVHLGARRDRLRQLMATLARVRTSVQVECKDSGGQREPCAVEPGELRRRPATCPDGRAASRAAFQASVSSRCNKKVPVDRLTSWSSASRTVPSP
jgi:hypothetical protein